MYCRKRGRGGNAIISHVDGIGISRGCGRRQECLYGRHVGVGAQHDGIRLAQVLAIGACEELLDASQGKAAVLRGEGVVKGEEGIQTGRRRQQGIADGYASVQCFECLTVQRNAVDTVAFISHLRMAAVGKFCTAAGARPRDPFAGCFAFIHG